MRLWAGVSGPLGALTTTSLIFISGGLLVFVFSPQQTHRGLDPIGSTQHRPPPILLLEQQLGSVGVLGLYAGLDQ